jgi:hypothetical protein
MRVLGVLLIVAAVVLGLRPHVPGLSAVTLPDLGLGAVALALLGLVLLLLPRGRPAVERDQVAEALAASGFAFADEAHGWRARGEWKGRRIEIRRVRGYEASRFGLERVVEVTVRGVPSEPWPLAADQARIVDRRDHAVSVALPTVSRPGGEAGLGAQLDRVLAEIAPPA